MNQNLLIQQVQGASCIVVSDIHIRSPEDSRAIILGNLIGALSTSNDLKYFILLGDIFDFFFARKEYYFRKYKNLFDGISSLQKKGVEVIFFEGNHEFDLESVKKLCPIKVVEEGDLNLTLEGGKTLKLAHGDLVYADESYLKFRAFVKSPTIKKLAALIPSRILEWYALNHARYSRAREKPLDRNALLAQVNDWLKKDHAKTAIIGHFHTALGEELPCGAKIYATTSWDHPSFLWVDRDANVKRFELKS